MALLSWKPAMAIGLEEEATLIGRRGLELLGSGMVPLPTHQVFYTMLLEENTTSHFDQAISEVTTHDLFDDMSKHDILLGGPFMDMDWDEELEHGRDWPGDLVDQLAHLEDYQVDNDSMSIDVI